MAVACAAAAADAANAAATARGVSCINYRTKASTEPGCCCINHRTEAAAAEEKLLHVWKCNCSSRHNSVDVANY